MLNCCFVFFTLEHSQQAVLTALMITQSKASLLLVFLLMLIFHFGHRYLLISMIKTFRLHLYLGKKCSHCIMLFFF